MKEFHVRNIKGQKIQLFQPTSFTFILDQKRRRCEIVVLEI